MNVPTATKQYVINELPNDPSQITLETFNTTLGSFGASTIRWQRVGKLYFGLYFTTVGGLQPLFDPDATTQAELESILGVSINIAYTGLSYGAYIGEFNGVWNSILPANNTRNTLWGFLIN